MSLLPPCPGTPNCVSSLAEDPAKMVDPFPVKDSPRSSMELLASIMGSMRRSTIVSSEPCRIDAEFRSFLGFVDDLVFAAEREGDVIHVRSAARSGIWDLGVNRRRVEKIRKKYMGKGISGPRF